VQLASELGSEGVSAGCSPAVDHSPAGLLAVEKAGRSWHPYQAVKQQGWPAGFAPEVGGKPAVGSGSAYSAAVEQEGQYIAVGQTAVSAEQAVAVAKGIGYTAAGAAGLPAALGQCGPWFSDAS
jgi:hypothetical protein